ncbi:OmpA family protein [Sulfitobacter dubius]|uniref:OmpA family protein n=1 Tax=Sulfitobacter dubius TaxID=218673 RepID=UPI0022B01E93|nr:OmpA family protein [Sulfitobacter dubius]MCZ4367539.1 OmpA family protein [Sulfitobacter dubius]
MYAFMKSILSSLLAVVVATFAQAGPFDEFSKSLVGFQCELEGKRELVLFGEIDGQLSLLSPSSIDPRENSVPVDKTDVGYRFPVEHGILAFLSNINEKGWMLFYSTENGPWSTKCTEVRDLPLDVANALLASLDLFSRTALDNLSRELAEALRQNELLTQQVILLRKQLNDLQSLLDDSVARGAAGAVEVQSLRSELNFALARIAVHQRQLQFEEMTKYQTLFQRRVREELGDKKWVKISGSRLIIPTQLIFPPGGMVLSDDGKDELNKVAGVLRSVLEEVPETRDYFIRVDGHTDDVPLSGFGEAADNWELSQARALAVVKFLVEAHGIAPHRLSANGFGQFKPLARGNSEEARSQNRRIELTWSDR